MHNEIDLLYKARKGDKSAMENIILLYDRKIYSFIFNIVKDENDAVDITQETFLKLFMNITKFDMNKNFSTWLYTIAKNTAFNHMKENKKNKFVDNHNDFNNIDLQDGKSNPANIYERKETQQRLIELIDILPEKYKILIQMKYVFNLSYEEISEKLGIPTYRVESRLFMARKRLLKQITKNKNDGFYNMFIHYFINKSKIVKE